MRKSLITIGSALKTPKLPMCPKQFFNNLFVGTKITRAFISQGKTEIGECSWLFSPGLGVEYFSVDLEMEMSGYMWMRTSGVEATYMSERASES